MSDSESENSSNESDDQSSDNSNSNDSNESENSNLSESSNTLQKFESKKLVPSSIIEVNLNPQSHKKLLGISFGVKKKSKNTYLNSVQSITGDMDRMWSNFTTNVVIKPPIKKDYGVLRPIPQNPQNKSEINNNPEIEPATFKFKFDRLVDYEKYKCNGLTLKSNEQSKIPQQEIQTNQVVVKNNLFENTPIKIESFGIIKEPKSIQLKPVAKTSKEKIKEESLKITKPDLTFQEKKNFKNKFPNEKSNEKEKEKESNEQTKQISKAKISKPISPKTQVSKIKKEIREYSRSGIEHYIEKSPETNINHMRTMKDLYKNSTAIDKKPIIYGNYGQLNLSNNIQNIVKKDLKDFNTSYSNSKGFYSKKDFLSREVNDIELDKRKILI